MSGTVHLQTYRNAVRAVLEAGLAAVADGGVIAGRRTRPMAEQHSRQVHVYADFSKPVRAEISGQPDDWMTRLRLECAARAVAGLSGEDAADDLAAQAYALVMSDPTLGGLQVIDLIPVGLTWDSEESDLTMGVCQVLFDVKHRTPYDSISA